MSHSPPPTVGSVAPDFELYTHDVESWRLSEQGRPAVLLFFPGAFTSVCTAELKAVNGDLEEYEGTEVVGISTDSPFVLEEFRSAHGFKFPLLSDHNGEVSKEYGAKYDGNFTPMNLDRISKRAAFVVDAAQTIRYAEVLDDAGNLPDFDAIKESLRALRV